MKFDEGDVPRSDNRAVTIHGFIDRLPACGDDVSRRVLTQDYPPIATDRVKYRFVVLMQFSIAQHLLACLCVRRARMHGQDFADLGA